MASESTSLLKADASGPKSFYFLNKQPKSTEDGEKEYIPEKSTEDNGHAETSLWQRFGSLFGRKTKAYQPVETYSKPRKVPVKVEPKVFFANERTFLAWLHMSVTLASISVAIVAFAEANEWSQLYGLLLMPVAISFCVYSLYMYVKRAAMIRRKDPGPYEDRVGPVVLASMLSLAILINFGVKMYDISTSSL
mmetsp:Transcript_27670/g.39283  ORF Transcript_27670/g.39283 Transcript_27670/m.39283 type:complete len:193 (-) Transcript_27670:324-902(-)